MYPEALIGRGTAHAFQRELEAAILDFTKVLELAIPQQYAKIILISSSEWLIQLIFLGYSIEPIGW